MVVRGAGETFNLIVPIRRIREWAQRTGVLFALDDSIPVPSAEELRKIPVEDTGKDFAAAGTASDKDKLHDNLQEKFPFLIILDDPCNCDKDKEGK
jgi:hypothetical protein